ncbi:MAG: DUF1844 domain-containing protein [Verrucomicrobia bacterium]|nr:DUF1844 domain-containing protein [Verrucomicrobiota bacterium]
MSEVTLKERQSALFANLVLQQTNAALLFLGKLPDPETGQPSTDLEKASLFIDTLEMLAARTRGNLEGHEQEFLQQNLTTLRMQFVEAVDHGPSPPTTPPAPSPADPGRPAPPSQAATDAPPSGETVDDARKKFVKKY